MKNRINNSYITLFQSINRILTEWDPLSIGDDNVASSEYLGYIPSILEIIENKQNLMNHLEDLLNNELGLDYDATNKEHVADLEDVSEKLIQVYKEAKAGF